MKQKEAAEEMKMFVLLHDVDKTAEVAKDIMRKEKRLEDIMVGGRENEIEFAIELREDQLLTTLKKYLSCAIFRDIGPVTARRIVSFFGLQTAQVIETALHEVLKVQGVGKKRMTALQNGWAYQKRVIIEAEELIRLRSIHRDAM